jgi:hypothetical protein
MKRIVIGAFTGAVIMFVWGAFSHMVLLIGVGFNRMPDEDAVIEKLRNSIPKEGLYFFPIIDFRGNPTVDQRAAWEAKYRAGPTGLLLYHPTGGAPLSSKKLLTQFLSNLLSAGIAAYIVSLVLAPYWQRVLAITLFGVFAWLSISAIYWNWYGFPTSFFVAQGVDQTVGWLLAGFAMAKLVPSFTRSSPDMMAANH